MLSPITSAQQCFYHGIKDSLGEFNLGSITLYPRKSLTNHHPDTKLGPGSRGQLHHQINVQKDAHQWEDRQNRDLWAESVHP